MSFEELQIKEWQQIDNIDITFHDRLTIITGANGSGKTTILANILARHCGWSVQSVKTPKKNLKTKIFDWVSSWSNFLDSMDKQNVNIGKIIYSNGSESTFIDPVGSGAAYNLNLQNQQPVNCFFIPSHRSIFKYERINNIPTTIINKKNAFSKVLSSTMGRYNGTGGQSSSYHIKETLISWNIFGHGNDSMEPDEKLLKDYNGFEEKLKMVLPETLGFQKFSIRDFEVVMVCKSGDFILDGASGGISAIIDLCWQLYMFSDDKLAKFTAIIDEVENHLHPKLQREILPNFLKGFPNVNFIVSTHSPLIISSVKDSNVYALMYNEYNKIYSTKLDLIHEAKNANDILDEVLGVHTTIPIWAENKLNEILSKYGNMNLTDSNVFHNFRIELEENGLSNFVPNGILSLIEAKG